MYRMHIRLRIIFLSSNSQTAFMRNLTSHMKVHDNLTQVHCSGSESNIRDDHLNKIDGDSLKPTLFHLTKSGTSSSKKPSSCLHCDATFTNKVSLDNHVVKKHPNFIQSVTNKIYECTECSYTTSFKSNFNKHFRVMHPETGSCKSLVRCSQCDAKFTNKESLDDHVVEKHPNFTHQLYECTECIFKTTMKHMFYRHSSLHSKSSSNSEPCHESLNSKTALDEHIVKTHPNLSVSVGKKIFECPQCDFKAIGKRYLNNHMLTHSKTMSHYKLSTCKHCDATFRKKTSLNDHIIRKHPESATSVDSAVYKCTKCTYKTILRNDMEKHMSVHSEKPPKLTTCSHCNSTFVNKRMLDAHVVNQHPEFIATVSRKIHECKVCSYKTLYLTSFNTHMSVHPETAASLVPNRCVHCNATFRKKTSLEEHTLKKHPSFFEAGSKKIYECSQCDFKTTVKLYLDRHALSSVDDHIVRKHPDSAMTTSRKIHKCTQCSYKTCVKKNFHRHITMVHSETGASKSHCHATFENKSLLDNHVVKKHPNSIMTVNNKTYKCAECIYKTPFKNNFLRHLSEHPQTASYSERSICVHCSASLNNKTALDDHIVRKHPNFAKSVGRKIFECPQCSYRTVLKSYLGKHMLTHSKSPSPCTLNICIHCDAKFRKKTSLNDHIVKKHPDYATSVDSAVYECTSCTFKTIFKRNMESHMSVHSEFPPTYKMIPRSKKAGTTSSDKLHACMNCGAIFKSNGALEAHITKMHPELISSIPRQIHECTKCPYKSYVKKNFNKHVRLMHSENRSSKRLLLCNQCGATFKNKSSLDNHVVKKHPNFIKSVTHKIYECPECEFKTTFTTSFYRHLAGHPQTAPYFKRNMCVHCNASLSSKTALDIHIFRRHPDVAASIVKHMLTHSNTPTPCTLNTCIHCDATFKKKTSLNDHIVKKHPEFATSVNSVVYECSSCTFKTIYKRNMESHMSVHSEFPPTYKMIPCGHCNGTFKSKRSLDAHVLKNHPEFITSVSSKIHECEVCSYKTIHSTSYNAHMTTHSETVSSYGLSRCVHCDATFKTKLCLEEHTLKKHPSHFESNSKKVYGCSDCDFKTLVKRKADRHATRKRIIPKNQRQVESEKAGRESFSCYNCNHTVYSKQDLISHMNMHDNLRPVRYSEPGTSSQSSVTSKGEAVKDNHLMKKHPNLIKTVTRKVYECTECVYKTTFKATFDRHLSVHPQTASYFQRFICVHCYASFTNETSLDDHIVRRHPNEAASVGKKIFECPRCSFRTIRKSYFVKHTLTHSKTMSHSKLRPIIPRNQRQVESEKGGRESFSCYSCNHTIYSKQDLISHMNMHDNLRPLRYSEPGTSSQSSVTSKGEAVKDNHLMKKHPNSATSVDSTIYECPSCNYKSTFRSHIKKHICVHSETHRSNKLSSIIPKNQRQGESENAGRESFSCYNCNHTVYSKQDLISHMNMHDKLRPVRYSEPGTSSQSSVTSKGEAVKDNHLMKKHPNLIKTVTRKIYECTECVYKTTFKGIFNRHLSLGNHIIKRHPNSAESVGKEIFKCPQCSFSTIRKSYFVKHTLTHSKTMWHSKLRPCMHCGGTFATKASLNNHIVKKHPFYATSVDGTIYECPSCNYKSTLSSNINRHMWVHSETHPSNKLSSCSHCNVTFNREILLDAHVVNKHPEFITSVSRKIHECKICSYKTIYFIAFNTHMAKHSEPLLLYACMNCDATFKSNRALNHHTVRKHPDSVTTGSHKTSYKSNFTKHLRLVRVSVMQHSQTNKYPNSIMSVTNNIYECTECKYKTTFKNNFNRHLSVHTQIASDSKRSICIHCDALLSSKAALDDHVVRKHPDLAASRILRLCHTIRSACVYTVKQHSRKKASLNDHIIKKHPHCATSVNSAIYKCSSCTYKTTFKKNIERHMSVHSEAPPTHKLTTCRYCNTTFNSERGLDAHVVNKHPEFITSVSRKIHECKICFYKTIHLTTFNRHTSTYPETASSYGLSSTAKSKYARKQHPIVSEKTGRKTFSCYSCNYTVYRKCQLSNHMQVHQNKTFVDSIGRQRFNVIASVSSELYECKICPYKTSNKSDHLKHISRHPETAKTTYNKLFTCVHCESSFKSKRSLDDHTIRKHPDSAIATSRRIYECSDCSYKTCIRHKFGVHLLVHGFSSRSVKKHPDFKTTVITGKTYKCVRIAYKTTRKNSFDIPNALVHPEAVVKYGSDEHRNLSLPQTSRNYFLIPCTYCKATFRRRATLADHVLEKHPDLPPVDGKKLKSADCNRKIILKGDPDKHTNKKIYECGKCRFKTIIMANFDRHLASTSHLEKLNIKNHPFKKQYRVGNITFGILFSGVLNLHYIMKFCEAVLEEMHSRNSFLDGLVINVFI
nr:unnamed protein product [Callosobruchus analis]